MIEFRFTARAGTFELRAAGSARTPGVIGVFGPSGAGKTTLLRAIAGLAPLTSGAIALVCREGRLDMDEVRVRPI